MRPEGTPSPLPQKDGEQLHFVYNEESNPSDKVHSQNLSAFHTCMSLTILFTGDGNMGCAAGSVDRGTEETACTSCYSIKPERWDSASNSSPITCGC